MEGKQSKKYRNNYYCPKKAKNIDVRVNKSQIYINNTVLHLFPQPKMSQKFTCKLVLICDCLYCKYISSDMDRVTSA